MINLSNDFFFQKVIITVCIGGYDFKRDTLRSGFSFYELLNTIFLRSTGYRVNEINYFSIVHHKNSIN